MGGMRNDDTVHCNLVAPSRRGGCTDSVVVAGRPRLVYWCVLVGLAFGLAVCLGVRPLYAENETYSVSVRAFIPNNVAGAKQIPGQSGTMVGPALLAPVMGCFDTDQRGFSNSLSASSRVTATVRSYHSSYSGHSYSADYSTEKTCGLTTQRNCGTGQVIKQAHCEPDNVIEIQCWTHHDDRVQFSIARVG